MIERTKKTASRKGRPAGRVDHRTLVGRSRRAITETRIIRAAVQVFAERGPDAPVIEDFIVAAGIARGTFYNYFKSTEELLKASSNWLSEDLMAAIERRVRSLKDPAARFGVGIRLWMRWAQANPSWSLFIARVWHVGQLDQPVRDIREGIRKKIFFVPDLDVAWDVVRGSIRQAMFRIGEGNVRKSYGDSVVEMCLQALGLEKESTREIMGIELPDIPD